MGHSTQTGLKKQKIISRILIFFGAIFFVFGLINFINNRIDDGNRNPPTSDEILAEYRKIQIYREDRETSRLKLIKKSGLIIAEAHYKTEKTEDYLEGYYKDEMKSVGYTLTQSGTNPSGEKYAVFSSGRYTATVQFHRENNELIYYFGLESKG
jgi:ABC-type uncharacterized transport system permease subunit